MKLQQETQRRVRAAVLHGLLKHKGKLQLKMDGMEKEIQELKMS